MIIHSSNIHSSIQVDTKTPAQIHDQHHVSGAHACPETACLSAIRVLLKNTPPSQLKMAFSKLCAGGQIVPEEHYQSNGNDLQGRIAI